MTESKQMLTTQQFADSAGVSKNTVSKWLREGKIEGRKLGGKWTVPVDELQKVASPGASPAEQIQAPAARIDTNPSAATGFQSNGSYTLDEFSAMTYLTPFGVEQWLKQGRLKGFRDDKGQWRVDGANLMIEDVRRLLRN
jgi:excisionase family DNA binding protein